MKRTYVTALLAALALFGGAARADEVSERLAARMSKLFPKERVTDIAPSPVPGLYEIMVGASLFYISADGRYVVHGDLIDLDTRSNVSDQRRAVARKQIFESMDDKSFIDFPSTQKETKKTLYVFTDIDCAYCRKMHSEIGRLNDAGIRVRYLAFPRTGLKSASYDKAAAVWCAPNRQEALTQAKLGMPINAPECDNPVAKEFEMGQAMGVTGTPSVYTDKGKPIGGYVPAEEVIKMVNDGKI